MLQRVFLYPDPIYADASPRYIVKSGNQIDQCTLPGTCTADNTDGLALFDRKAEISQGIFIILIVRKRNILKLYFIIRFGGYFG